MELETDSELLKEFVTEAKAHLETIEAGLLRLEEGEEDDGTINEIFRAAHSIKGTAGFFGLNKIVELSHCLENLFGEFREHRLKVNSEMIDAMLSAGDMLKKLINMSPAAGEKYDITEQVAAIKRFLAVPQTKPVDQSGLFSVWDVWNQLTSNDAPVLEKREDPAAHCDKSSQRAVVKEDNAAVPVARKDAVPPREIMVKDSIRVNVGLLNDLLNLAGEMVLRRNQLLRISQENGDRVPQLELVARSIDELTTNLQKKVMQTRMQPIANVFNKFPRIVRDLSHKVNKEVDLTMQGLEVELDRSLIEALVDPLTHLVRNALDHGIETAEIRAEKHKPIPGSLVLHAYHESGRVLVDVCDDGAGIDVEKVRAKAVQKGLIGENESKALDEADIINLIMTPGFSTAEEITDISGRGVGMDVVKTNIEKLGGKIEVFSDPGKGTTFRLILPLTLAIISAFIVAVDGKSFVIPQANVRELLLIQPGETGEKRVEVVQNRPVLRLRGRLFPLVRLADILAGETPPAAAAVKAFANTEQLLRVLVIKAGSMVYGLVVDSVYDTEEILVKPLSTVLGNCGLYSGVTVLGDGSISMILDTERIRRRAGISFIQDTSLAANDAMKPIGAEKQYLLLFNCSGGETLGLDLAMVSRIVATEVSRLQKIGSRYYIFYQGQTIRVIRPEHHLPLSRKKNHLDKVYIILPKLVKYTVGILAEKIEDALYTQVSLDKDGVCGTGILGSAMINGTVVTLLNIHELFAKAAPEYYHRPIQRDEGQGAAEKKNTILLVEDTPFFLKVVKSYLESDGYEVLSAENGRQALEKLRQSRVDVVISDIEMPLMNGFELVRAIRADEKLRQLPVIALTSLTGEVNRDKGLRAGFDIYEYKFDRLRLLESIHEVLGKRAEPRQRG
ncbi:MAG: hybrid sensor histidine kinase/response regulator [Veillonellales bacterium]